jgi:hypothetical protein
VAKGIRDEVCDKYPKEAVALIPYAFSYVVRKYGVRTAKEICADAREDSTWGYSQAMSDQVCLGKDLEWDKHYGAGILDAEAVLRHTAVPEIDEVCNDIRSRGGNPPKACPPKD